MKSLSPKLAAQALGVSESSLKRWCDKGLIRTHKTGCGHRKINASELVRFARLHPHPIVDGRLLDMGDLSGSGRVSITSAATVFADALAVGDDGRLRTAFFSQFIAGTPLAAILDSVVAPALHRVGEAWEHGQLAVYEERRACELVVRLLHSVRESYRTSDSPAPLVLGGSLEGDNYNVPVAMSDLIAVDVGARSVCLGTAIPASSVAVAVRENRPALVWLSLSFCADAVAARQGIESIRGVCEEVGCELVLGGRVIGLLSLVPCANLHVGESMAALSGHVKGLIGRSSDV